MARKAFSISYARFILLDKTRIWLGMARKAFYIPYPRFILLDKTQIWLGMARKAFYTPYPRFILLDKTRIWLGKHVSQEFMISVRPSATHPSVRPLLIRPSVSAFYPNLMGNLVNTRRCEHPATLPNCVSYSYTVRACLIVTVHGPFRAQIHFVLQDEVLTAHGLYRCTEYRLLSEPMSTRLLNSISSRICRQNTQFNMYTTTSKQEEGCTFKDSHPKCFITTNFDKFYREAFARSGESR